MPEPFDARLKFTAIYFIFIYSNKKKLLFRKLNCHYLNLYLVSKTIVNEHR